MPQTTADLQIEPAVPARSRAPSRSAPAIDGRLKGDSVVDAADPDLPASLVFREERQNTAVTGCEGDDVNRRIVFCLNACGSTALTRQRRRMPYRRAHVG